MTNKKIKALADFLQVSKKEAQNLIDNEEYVVLTDEEATEKAAEEIKNSLWAFNSDFILQHCKNADSMDCYEWNSAVEALRGAQSRSCESLNGLVYALIDDIDKFVRDAIEADGRGHFIAFYDGEENEQNGLFIYRLN